MTVPRRRRWINDLDQGKYANVGRMRVCRPNEKCPWGRRDICLFALCVNTFGDGGYVQAKKEDVGEYVQDLGNSLIVSRNYRKKGGGITLSAIPSLQESAMVVLLTRV